jgi:hypothetical protein
MFSGDLWDHRWSYEATYQRDALDRGLVVLLREIEYIGETRGAKRSILQPLNPFIR